MKSPHSLAEAGGEGDRGGKLSSQQFSKSPVFYGAVSSRLIQTEDGAASWLSELGLNFLNLKLIANRISRSG